MTTDGALDFLLEKVMQLMNSGEELLLIEKEEMEWVYEEMQFLRKFLKDSEEIREELKEIVAKIRDVTYQVEDIIDSFVLFNTVLKMDGSVAGVEFPLLFSRLNDIMKMKEIYCDSVFMAKKISDGSKTLMKDIDCIRRSKTQMIEIISWLAEKINDFDDDDDDGVIEEEKEEEEIRSLINQVMEIHEKRLGTLRWLESSHAPEEVDLLCNLSDKVLYWGEKDPDPIACCKRRILFGRLCFHIPWIVPLVFRRFNDMVDLAKKIHHQFGCAMEELKPIMTLLIKIYQKGSSVTWLESQVTDRICLLFNLLEQIIILAEKIHHEFGGVIEESKAVNIEAMEAIKWGINEFIRYMHQGLDDVKDDIKSIKREGMEIYEKKMYGIGGGVLQIGSSSHGASSKPTNPVLVEETVVGFDDDIRTMMELLTEQHEKNLKIIPIVGMPGLGKTTIARKLYNDPFIVYHFYIRAWTYVSQVYNKRDLLLSILSSAQIHLKDKIDKMSDEELGESLYKYLKGKTYLIVMDDLWELRAWDNLKRYFPNDHNGSRIIFTSRLVDVALHAHPYNLRFLNEDESWDLLRAKTFGKESCPPELMEIGNQIAKKCQGLPLAIVVVSGLLAKNDKTEEWWRHVAESVSSYMASDPEQYMETLAMSFNHLPRHLKPCFLYFGAFPEDYEIPVRQLMWLWVSEGFVRQNEQKSLEEVAEDYLMDLIGRSLVVVSKKRSNGGIKACRVHDLLRDLCLRKTQEENFLQQIIGYEHTSASSSSSPSSSSSLIPNKQRRLCIHSHLVEYPSIKYHVLNVRSFLSFNLSFYDLPERDVSFVCQAFKFLRVLSLLSIEVSFLPIEIEVLFNLRYLALNVGQCDHFKLPISKLWNLETLFIEGSKSKLVLSDDILKMVNLRHLYTKQSIKILGESVDGRPYLLDNLQTIGKLDLEELNLYGLYMKFLKRNPTSLIGFENFKESLGLDNHFVKYDLCGGYKRALKWIPNLRKLKCVCEHFPELDFLVCLETLNVVYRWSRTKFLHLNKFPPNLKSLTLSNFSLPWNQMSTLGRLPNLEVLKLSYKAFEGPRWDTSDGEFRKLRYLKFQRLDIKLWNASATHFPCLQTLMLDDCKLLKEIPCGVGDIGTLQMIQLRYCSSSAENSARQIHEQQQSMGNDELKILIDPWDPELTVFKDDSGKMGF